MSVMSWGARYNGHDYDWLRNSDEIILYIDNEVFYEIQTYDKKEIAQKLKFYKDEKDKLEQKPFYNHHGIPADIETGYKVMKFCLELLEDTK